MEIKKNVIELCSVAVIDLNCGMLSIFSFLWNRCAGGREVGFGFFSRLFFYWRVASLLKNKNNIYGYGERERERGLTEKCE